MNLLPIFEKQAILDKVIMETHMVDTNSVLNKRICALLVEIGEFANEISPFKYWKKNIVQKKDLILEEFVDGIHFLTSIALQLNASPDEITSKKVSEDQTEQLNEIFYSSSKLIKEANKKNVIEAYSIYLGILELLNIDFETVNKYYDSKNKVNFERIKNNY